MYKEGDGGIVKREEGRKRKEEGRRKIQGQKEGWFCGCHVFFVSFISSVTYHHHLTMSETLK